MTGRMIGAGLALLALAACNSSGEPGAGRQVLAQIQAMRGQDAGNRITASDAELRAYPQDLMLVEIPSKDSSAGLLRQVENTRSVTWIAPDGVALTLARGGQLIGTAGLGGDLSSAEVPDIRRARGAARRVHYYLGGDELVRPSRYACEITEAGAESVEVAGVAYPARRVEEACRGEDGIAFENLYWLQADGLIRESRQWVSSEVGYVVIEDVHGGRGL